jgi:hypothetical protein
MRALKTRESPWALYAPSDKNVELHIPNNFTSGRSKKAIGHESQIGPCVATHQVDNCQAWSFQQNEWRRHDTEMEPRGKEKRFAAYRDETNRTSEEDHSQIVGCTLNRLG